MLLFRFIKLIVFSLIKRLFFRFVLVGLMAALVHYIVYLLLQFYMEPSLAYALAYLISLVFNYMLSSSFTFRRKRNLKNTMGFFFSHLVNYINHILLFRFFIYLGINRFIVPIFVLMIAVPLNFILLRYVFNNKRFR